MINHANVRNLSHEPCGLKYWQCLATVARQVNRGLAWLAMVKEQLCQTTTKTHSESFRFNLIQKFLFPSGPDSILSNIRHPDKIS